MSAAELGAENLLRPLSQVRLCLKRREKRQVSPMPAVLGDPAADRLQHSGAAPGTYLISDADINH